MAEIDRLSQYRYLIRAMRLEDKRSLEKARRGFSRDGIDVFDDDFVFRHATPQSHDFVWTTTKFFGLLYEHQTPGERGFYGLLEPYLVIGFDEVCCGGWDRYLAVVAGVLCTRCQFCGSLYDLGGAKVDSQPSLLANRKLLVERFGAGSEPQWMRTETLARLVGAAR